jgi:hypothetical protein
MIRFFGLPCPIGGKFGEFVPSPGEGGRIARTAVDVKASFSRDHARLFIKNAQYIEK